MRTFTRAWKQATNVLGTRTQFSDVKFFFNKYLTKFTDKEIDNEKFHWINLCSLRIDRDYRKNNTKLTTLQGVGDDY